VRFDSWQHPNTIPVFITQVFNNDTVRDQNVSAMVVDAVLHADGFVVSVQCRKRSKKPKVKHKAYLSFIG